MKAFASKITLSNGYKRILGTYQEQQQLRYQTLWLSIELSNVSQQAVRHTKVK